MQKEYKTVLSTASSEYEEKKSKFIASVSPAGTEEEALGFINSLKSKYWDASHNVYAYCIGGNNTVQRFSDDGEPSGTAGMPVMEVIKRMELQNLAVVVTRYFGGTLLGAAGLIRAYGKSAAMGIEAAGIIRRQLCRTVNIITEYTLFGRIRNFVSSKGYIIRDVIYSEDVEIILSVPQDDAERVIGELDELTNARAVAQAGEVLYVSTDMDGSVIK
ncbi:putative YigZ family protein [Anaerobacterium chartisolvens]|uniref:Putative YigZ family protein n=1 Tax=Anaerobacterium chartisolvens TaxID=1297424 RepID=A0A369B9U6_9FIRM|nr:YigZ family protein [Anaerobacterium chartisolvens]RCX18309.1 putative YigZ family protein [Anaerobacterium chartisolvens]